MTAPDHLPEPFKNTCANGGVHTWLALESGTHSIGRQTVVAGTGTANEAGTTLAFGQAFASAPVVLAQVTSTSDPDAVSDRIADVTATGFAINLDDEEANAGLHGPERVAWIAASPGGSASSGLLAAKTGTAVSHASFTTSFSTAFADDFAFIADMQTQNGTDPATVRLRALGVSGATFFLEEEAPKDAEVSHGKEDVGYLALTTGLIYDDLIA